MKVILLADVKKLGKKGQTIEVSDGYAANFLIPRKLAVASTISSQDKLEKDNAAEEARQIQLKKDAEVLSKKLDTIEVLFKTKVSNDGRMFGSISTKEIAEGLEAQHGIIIDKRKFIDKTPANSLGYTRLKIELYKGSQGLVTGVVSVHIVEDK